MARNFRLRYKSEFGTDLTMWTPMSVLPNGRAPDEKSNDFNCGEASKAFSLKTIEVN